MKSRLKFVSLYGIFWVLFFVLFRVYFFVQNSDQTALLPWSDYFLSFLYGLKLDVVMAAYFLALPILLIIGFSFGRKNILLKNILWYYTLVFSFVSGFIAISDMKLYSYWDLKMDSSVLSYFDNPKMIAASIGFFDVFNPVAVLLLTLFVFVLLYKKYISKYILDFKRSLIKIPISFTLIAGLLFLIMRGGIDVYPKIRLGIPISISSIFFSQHIFANDAAANPVWYFLKSLTKEDNNDDRFFFMSDEKAEGICEELINDKSVDFPMVLRTDRPNIIFLILESFTANIIGPLGGPDFVTPELNKLSEEGILFTNFYASGTRSPKGISAIYSSFPAMPRSSVMEVANKYKSINYSIRDLKELGYETAFYYGGDMNFANFNAYFTACQTDHIISRDNYPVSDHLSKWGVADHIQLDRLMKDLSHVEGPFFYSLFTLNSHNPFDVPMETVIEGTDDDHMFMNSAYYVDKSVGNFIREAKKQAWWDNTLIVITADHSVKYVSTDPVYHPSKFKIPMIWIGGALIPKGLVVDKIGSQVDITKTLFAQMGLDASGYRYSKNLLAEDSRSYAFYTMNQAFAYLNDSVTEVYNVDIGKRMMNEGLSDTSDFVIGKALMQYSLKDFLSR